MKHFLFILAISTFAHLYFLGGSRIATAQTTDREPIQRLETKTGTVEVVAGESLVKVADISKRALFDSYTRSIGCKAIKEFQEIGWTLLEFPDSIDVRSEISVLRASGLVSEAEPNYIAHVSSISPPDIYFANQWYFESWGIPHSNIYADKAWDITQGDSSVIIGILDSGIPADEQALKLTHVDLDDVSNFKIRLGADHTGEGQYTLPDYLGHGTLVAGIAGAEARNYDTSLSTCGITQPGYASGTVGVSWKSPLYIEKVFRYNNYSQTDWILSGMSNLINYKRGNPTYRMIINFSANWLNVDTINAVEDEINYAASNNVLCAFTTGDYAANDQNFLIEAPATYASYARPYYAPRTRWTNVIAVGATNLYDSMASYSKYLPRSVSQAKVSVAAPGGDGSQALFVDLPNYPTTNFPTQTCYGEAEGTSLAAPQISGIAALIWSISPALPADTVRAIIEATADTVGPYSYNGNHYTQKLGNGRANAYEALRYTLAHYNCVLRDSINLYESLTTSSGTTLTVQPGAHIAFGPGVTLNINGSLLAKGTSSQPITFTSTNTSPSPGDWYAIRLEGGPDTLQYCNIRYASYGVINYTTASHVLELDSIDHCLNYGVYNYGNASGAMRIQGCTIANNSGDAVGISGGWVSIEPYGATVTSLQGNSYQGIYMYNSTLYLNRVTIQNNSSYGVWVDGSSNAEFTPNGVRPGFNAVMDNATKQIWVTGGTAFLGRAIQICTCPSSTLSVSPLSTCNPPCYLELIANGGYNSVSGSGYWIYNGTANTVYADYTYWGNPPACPPPSSEFYGTVTRNYPQGCDGAGAGTKLLVSSGGEGAQQTLNASITDDSSKAATLIQYLVWEVENQPDSSVSAIPILASFVGPTGAYPNALGVPWKYYLAKLAQSTPSTMMKSEAFLFLLRALVIERRYDTALFLADSISNLQLGDDVGFGCKAEKIYSYIGMGDVAAAREVYSGLSAKATSTNSRALNELLTMINDKASLLASSAVTQEIPPGRPNTKHGKPTQFELFQSYPNPFNPTATIAYNLPEDVHVSLKIFNVLGQLVSTLVDEIQLAGYKQVTFNATTLPTGVYMYRLEAGNFTAVKKMILAK